MRNFKSRRNGGGFQALKKQRYLLHFLTEKDLRITTRDGDFIKRAKIISFKASFFAAGERCPYENVDARSRVRRELISDQQINSINSTGQNQSETDHMINGPVVESLKSSPMQNFFKRIVKKRETEFVRFKI